MAAIVSGRDFELERGGLGKMKISTRTGARIFSYAEIHFLQEKLTFHRGSSPGVFMWPVQKLFPLLRETFLLALSSAMR